MNRDEQTTLLRKSYQTDPCYNCKDIGMANPKLDQRCAVCGTSPAQRILNQRSAKRQASKPMNKQGKGARRNTQNLRKNKERFEREGIDCCQLCDRPGNNLSNSHTNNEDRRDVNAKTALLCIWPCHQFLQERCTTEQRSTINQFLIDTTLEGEHRFLEAMKYLSEEQVLYLMSKMEEQQ